MPTSPIALDFARFVLRQNPGVTSFSLLYDAMARTAAARKFRNFGYRELAEVGVSFSLLATGRLEALINEALAAEPSSTSFKVPPQAN
jgi:hypothetical protein